MSYGPEGKPPTRLPSDILRRARRRSAGGHPDTCRGLYDTVYYKRRGGQVSQPLLCTAMELSKDTRPGRPSSPVEASKEGMGRYIQLTSLLLRFHFGLE
jgi:hypothetical protein